MTGDLHGVSLFRLLILLTGFGLYIDNTLGFSQQKRGRWLENGWILGLWNTDKGTVRDHMETASKHAS